MRVYVSVDMEGLAGVAHPAQTYFGPPSTEDRTDYDRTRGLMAGETNAAVEAALEAGATDVVVNDSHWRMRNLRAEDLHPGARLIIGTKPYSMTEGIDEGFEAALFVGYHAGAGHPSGVIAHTYSSDVITGVRINDVPHNEAALNAMRLGHHGVPVALVAGDDALSEEVEQLLPWAERVVVKRARAERVADSLSPSEAQAAIRHGVAAALGRLADMVVYLPRAPIRVELDVRQPGMADYAAVLPEIERIGPRTVAFRAADGEGAYRLVLAAMRLAAASQA